MYIQALGIWLVNLFMCEYMWQKVILLCILTVHATVLDVLYCLNLSEGHMCSVGTSDVGLPLMYMCMCIVPFLAWFPHSSPPWFTSIGSSLLVHVSSGLCWEGGGGGTFTPLCQNYAPSLDLWALCEMWEQDSDASPNLLTVNFLLPLDKFPKCMTPWPCRIVLCIVYICRGKLNLFWIQSAMMWAQWKVKYVHWYHIKKLNYTQCVLICIYVCTTTVCVCNMRSLLWISYSFHPMHL